MKLKKTLLGLRKSESAVSQDAEEISGLEASQAELVAEYQEITLMQVGRLGILADSVSIEVNDAGLAQDGRKVVLVMLRLVMWEGSCSLRLLMALPLLEAKMRKAVQATWLNEVSHFAGLWVRAASGVQTTETLKDIQRTLLELELVSGSSLNSRQSNTPWSASVPADL